MEIQELDARTVERIAAGEVVERPASAVKELVENAIDADASRIEVAVEAGGIEGIRVADDGVGMSETAVRRAVREHTTSKIGDIEDLERGVESLGFRGEALHAIGAVSRLTITTRPRDPAPGDPDRGTELTVEGGEVTGVEPAGRPAGTTVEVTDLFYNVPARRKYLKQPATEFGHVNRVVTGYALANPDVAVSLEHDGRETFATTGGGDRREAVMAVYGREVAAAMVPVEAAGGELPDGPLDAVSGLVSHPETTRASRDYLSTFVNGRYVTASAVREAVVEAYGSQLAGDRYPFAALSLSVDPADVDVNVHPRKLEVRFADEAGVREQIRAAVEGTLLSEGLIRSRAPRGRSAPDQAEIDPGGPAGPADPSEPSGSGDEQRGSHDRNDPQPDTPSQPSDGADASARPSDEADAGRAPVGTGEDRPPEGVDAGGAPESETASGAGGSAQAGPGGPETGGRKFRGGRQERLDEGTVGERREFDRLPAMTVLGQFRDTYLVAETADGLVLVDQHAADERVNYERLAEAFGADVRTQALAEPVELSVTAAEAAAADASGEALARLGFRVERTGERAVTVRTVPALLADEPAVVQDLLADLAGGRDPADTVEAAADELLADLACHPSVTGNTSLTEGSVLDLLAALDGCENPYACPHGRPTIVEFDDGEIEARFERDYPGHE
jgi:DNA mismatch repair protein MutL